MSGSCQMTRAAQHTAELTCESPHRVRLHLQPAVHVF